MIPQRLLDFGERNTEKPNSAAIFSHFRTEGFHLFARPVTGVRRTDKVYRRKHQSPLCHHISRHRAVNPARNQQHRFSARTDRQSAGTRQLLGMDIGAKIPNFYRHGDFGVMNIYL